jgi:hypothetical protein
MGFLMAVPAVMASVGSTVASVAPAVSAVAGIASSAMGIAGGIAQNNQQNAMAKAQMEASQNEANYQHNMNNYNAKLAEQQATTAEQEASEMERRKRAEGERLVGMQRALYGKSGVALYSGSPLAVLGDTVANQEMDALDIRREGQIRSLQLRNQATLNRYQGDVALSQAITSTPSYNGSLMASIGKGVAGMASSGADLFGSFKPGQIPGTPPSPSMAMNTRRPNSFANIA